MSHELTTVMVQVALFMLGLGQTERAFGSSGSVGSCLPLSQRPPGRPRAC